MKNFLKLIYILIPSLFFAQQSIKFETGTFKEILEKAKKENKIVFLDAYASWCGPCKLMEKNIFTLKSVSDYYNTHFINAHFDMEKGEGREIAQKFGIRSYPTYLFLNGNGELVMKNFGYMEENDFLQIAKEASNPENTKFSLKERFEKGESDPDFLINVMRQSIETDYDFAKKASERYFKNKKAENFTKDDVGMLFYFIRSTEDANYKIYQNSKTQILKFIPENIYSEFDTNIKISKILEISLDREKNIIKDDYFFANAIPLVGKDEATKALNRMKINFYPATGNYAEYEKAALEYYKNPDETDTNELLKAAWHFSEYIKTPSSLKKAQEWAEKIVMKSETPESTYILAKLYKATGNKEGAKSYAEISKRLAEQSGADSGMATQLLQEIQ